MSDISAPLGLSSGYVSDAELMGWLEQHSIDENETLRQMMQTSTVRTHLIQALTNIKAQVNANGNAGDTATMIDEMLSTDEFKDYKVELENLLGGTRDNIKNYAEGTDGGSGTMARDAAEAMGGEWDPNMADDNLKSDKSRLLERLDGEINRLGTDDQMAMVQIQALSSQARELSQLASNLMSSRSQARDGIVANIRG